MLGPFRTRIFVAGLTMALALAAAACTPRVANRGTIPDPDRINQIKVGETSKNDVERLIGSPSSTNAFGEEAWIYIGETTETTAFFEPEVSNRKVLVIHFDDKGIVKEVEGHGLEVARDIQPVERQTPTVGKQMTVIEQIVGNLNRYKTLNKDKK